MNRKKLNYRGFAALEVLLIILVLLIIGGVGYYVYQRSHNSKSSQGTTSSQMKSSEASLNSATQHQLSLIPLLTALHTFYSVEGPNNVTDAGHYYDSFYKPDSIVVSCYVNTHSQETLFNQLDSDFLKNSWRRVEDKQAVVDKVKAGDAVSVAEYYLRTGSKYEEYRTDLSFFTVTKTPDSNLNGYLCENNGLKQNLSEGTKILEVDTTHNT